MASDRRRWAGQIPTSGQGVKKLGATTRARTGESAQIGTHRFLTGRNPRTGHRGRHSVIVALEYLACMVMVLLSLGLVGKPSGKDSAETERLEVLGTPAVAMVRLSAVTLLFFVLAIFSVGRRSGRIAAAFGGLVAAGVALNATNEWRALAGLFDVKQKKTQKASS